MPEPERPGGHWYRVAVGKTFTDPGPLEFEAVITRNTEVANSSAFVTFPHGLKETFGVGNLVPVEVVFDGTVSYRGSLATMGDDRAHLLLRKDVRAALGKEPGDRVQVRLRLDTRPREVEVADDLAEALTRAGLRERFDALAYSHRKEFVRWVEEAKRPETRQRRIDGTCAMVSAGKTRN
jgi:hypothetical protein